MSEELVPQESEAFALTPDVLDEALDDTVGNPVGLLDALSLFRSGKGDWFDIGEEKKPHMYGIFLISKRPTRACWASDELSNDAPACWSIDGINPHELIAEPFNQQCAGCPNDALGSGQGRGKKCKTKAKDFFLLCAVTDQQAAQAEMSGETIILKQNDIVGPGMVDYSIGNRGSSRAFQSWQRTVRESGHRVQGVLTKWHFGKDRNKAGTEFDFVGMEMVAPLQSPEDAPALWALIVSNVKLLKGGQADDVLVALSGTGKDEDEE